jgi:hypothetical protein
MLLDHPGLVMDSEGFGKNMLEQLDFATGWSRKNLGDQDGDTKASFG